MHNALVYKLLFFFLSFNLSFVSIIYMTPAEKARNLKGKRFSSAPVISTGEFVG
jgi:hypothetical protein